MTVDLVISSFNNDLNWLKDISYINRIFIYDKSTEKQKFDSTLKNITFTKLCNIGCEHQSYLQHITDNYDNIADLTIFSQGAPFDHLYMSNQEFFDIIKYKSYYQFDSGYIDIMGGFVVSNIFGQSSAVEPHKLDCQSFANKFNVSISNPFLFQSNGIFAATKECIHNISRDMWKEMNEYIKNSCISILPDGKKLYLWATCSVYIMERMWFLLLNRQCTLPSIYTENKRAHPYGFSRLGL